MAVSASRVTVGTAATELSGTDHDRRAGSSLLIRPAADVYLGGPGVTTAAGYLVAAGMEFAVDLVLGDRLYAVAATGTVAVSVLRTGV